MHKRRGLASLVAAVLTLSASLAGVMATTGGASAAPYDDGTFRPPANDDFAAALAITPGATVRGTTLDATTQADDPGAGCGEARDPVWYRLKMPSAGVLRAAVSSGRVDMFRGNQLVALRRLSCGEAGVARVAAGDDVAIAVRGHGEGFELSTSLQPLVAPPNDAFDRAAPLAEGDAPAAYGATTQVGEPVPSCAEADDDLGSVWYRMTPTTPTHVRAFVTDLHSTVTLYEGNALSSLIEVACVGGTLDEQLLPGHDYRVAVRGPALYPADAVLRTTLLTPPANDDPVDAVTLRGVGDYAGTTQEATSSDEPAFPCATTSGAVWYRYVADSAHVLRVNAEVSSYTSQVATAIFRGAEPLACADNSGDQAAAEVEPGATYLIGVAAVPTWWGEGDSDFTLRVTSGRIEAGDRFDDATPVAFPGAIHPSVVGSHAPDDPSCIDWSPSAWYRFTAPAGTTGRLTITGGYTGVAVLDAADPSLLSPADARLLGCGAAVEAALIPGRTYWVAVANPSESGTIALRSSAAPANDTVADAAEAPTVGQLASGTTLRATAEPNEPACGGDHSVWYRYTPDTDGRATFALQSRAAHAISVVLAGGGASDAFTELRCSLRTDEMAAVTIPVAAGRQYLVRVAGPTDDTDDPADGDFTLTASFIEGTRPSNDDLGSAVPTLRDGSPVAGTVELATIEAGEPDHDCPLLVEVAGRSPGSVWYRYDAEQSTLARFRLESDDELGFTVYRGTDVSHLEAVRCRDRRLPGRDEVADLEVVPGTYWIVVDDRDALRGEPAPGQHFMFGVTTIDSAPANDGFADAQPLPLDSHVAGDTARATVETGEPAHDCGLNHGPFTRSVWYDLGVAPSDGRVTAAMRAEADQALALYEGTSLHDLWRVSCVDVPMTDEDVNAVTVRSGSHYFLAVLAESDEFTSEFGLDLAFVAAEGPSNDDFADAEPLPQGDDQPLLTIGATAEPGEPSGCGAGASVWYELTPPTDGLLRIGAQVAVHDFAIYTGSSLESLRSEYCSREPGDAAVTIGIGDASITVDGGATGGISLGSPSSADVRVVPVDAGVRYLVQFIAPAVADARPDAASTYSARFFPRAANDSAGEAATIRPGTDMSADLRGATPAAEGDEDFGPTCVSAYGASVWYRYVAPSTGVLELGLSPTSVEGGSPVIAPTVVSGPNTGALGSITCGEYDEALATSVPLPGTATWRYAVQAARTYWIRVAARSRAYESAFTLSSRLASAPAGDALRSRVPITLSPTSPTATWTGTTAGATPDATDDTDPWFGCGGSASVWMPFKAASNGVATITLAAPGDVKLGVHRANVASPRFSSLRELACADVSVEPADVGFDEDLTSGSSTTAIAVDAGSVYFLAANAPLATSGGDFVASVAWAPAPVTPQVSIDDARVTEPGPGEQTWLQVRLHLSQPTTKAIDVAYEIESQTGGDDDARAGWWSARFAPGATETTLDVEILGDGIDEDTETVAVHIEPTDSTVVRDGVGIVTIDDADPPPTVSVANVTTTEGSGRATSVGVPVTVSAPSARPITVSWRTFDGSAHSGDDFAGGSGEFLIPAGARGAVIAIPVVADRRPEPSETFYVSVTGVTNATIAAPTSTVTITDDDPPARTR